MVKVYNDRGTALAPAKVTTRIMPGVCPCPRGPGTLRKGGVDHGGCVNV
jgi:anaerobic dimethyl sulfoxide reductase subunit A